MKFKAIYRRCSPMDGVRPVASSTVRNAVVETLERRTFFAVTDWGDVEQLIRLPETIAAYQSSGGITGAGQTVAVIDSGIDYNHPGLGGGFGPGFKVVGGHDFVDNDNDPMDSYGHGTEVAGVIAANAFVADGLNHRGVSPGVDLVALRIDNDGTTTVPDSRLEDALRWCIDHRTEFGITVVNISYGSGHFNETVSSLVYSDEIQTLTDAGVSIVAASGNGGLPGGSAGIDAPAAEVNVISVGSVSGADRISNFSERGRPLDLLAPGEFVYTTLRLGGYGIVDGTSFSAPFVAGAVALMKSVNPNLRAFDVRSALAASSVPNFDGDSEATPNTGLTYGRLDLLSAVKLAASRKAGTPSEQAAVGLYGNGNSLVVDRYGVTHFVYYDSLAQTMKYATRGTDGAWSKLQIVDNTLPFAGYYLSMKVNSFGRPGIAFFDGTNGDLEYTSFDGINWNSEFVDVKNSVGLYPSLVYDRNDLPVISYYRRTTGDLKVANKSADGTWTLTNVDRSGDVGRETSIAIDGRGRIGIGYVSTSAKTVKFAILGPGAPGWVNTTVDQTTGGASFVSLAFDKNNEPAVSYYDSGPADLKLARFAGRRWTPGVLASRGGTGLFSSLVIRDDNVDIVYFDKRQNSVLVARREADLYTYQKLKTNAGRNIQAALNPLNERLIYSYLDNATGRLLVDVTDL